MLTISSVENQRPMRTREGEDRRNQPDRRRSGVDMRLRVGLWYQYHRVTRSGEFDPFPRNSYLEGKVAEALLPEMVKYEFMKAGTNEAVAPECALADGIRFLWSYPQVGCNATGESLAVYALNALSEYLCRTYKVVMLDRRKTDRRANSAKGC